MLDEPRIEDIRAGLRAAKDRREASEAIAPLGGLRGTEAIATIVDLMIEFEAWQDLLEEPLEAVVLRTPMLATRQRLRQGWRPPVWNLLERRGHRWAVSAVLTLHADGFVRERALRRLAETGDPRGWPFILSRTTDWVPQVARTAQSLYDLVTQSSSNEDLAPLLGAQRAVGQRRRGGGAGRKTFLEWLRRNPAALRDVFRGSAPDALWLLAGLTELDPDSPTFRAAVESIHGPVRCRAIQLLQPGPEAFRWAEKLARDPYPPVRLAVLDVAARAGDAGRPLLERGLLDPNMRVRTQARLALGPADYAARYREALPAPAAVEGLGETGTKADAASLVPLLAHPNPRVRRSAIRALVRLDVREATEAILRRIDDPSALVVREAYLATGPLNAVVGGDQLDAALADPRRRAAARRATLRHYRFSRRWETGARLMRYGEDPDLRPVALVQLGRWRQRMAGWKNPPHDAFRDDFELRLRRAAWLPPEWREYLKFDEGAGEAGRTWYPPPAVSTDK
jgi:HEAT repeat protein